MALGRPRPTSIPVLRPDLVADRSRGNPPDMSSSARTSGVAPPRTSAVIDLQSMGNVNGSDLPGALSWAAASRRSRFRQIVPFGLLGILAIVLAIFPATDVHRPTWLWSAGALFIVASLQIVLMPWHRLPAMWKHLPSATFCAGVILLREIDASGTTGFGVLLLLPIIWQAVDGRRIALALAVAQLAAALAIPVLVFEGYTVAHEIPRTILLLTVAGTLGVVLRTLIATVRARDRTIGNLVTVSRLLSNTEDPIGVLGAGIRLLTDADLVILASLGDGSEITGDVTVFERADRPGTSRRRVISDDAQTPKAVADLTVPTSSDVTFERRPDEPANPVGWPDDVAARLLVPVGPYGSPVCAAEARWHNRPRRPSTFDMSAMTLLGVDAGRALERVVVMEVLDDQAHRDELTNLANRRAWDELITRELTSARRNRRPLTVAVLDLDHFKRFNDRYGHLAGDDLLRDAATAWSHALRDPDVLARWGGEEFVVLLPDTRAPEAVTVIERLQKVTPGGQSFSAGVASLLDSDTAESLVAAADTAMYQAKAAGRHRVFTSTRA